MKRKVLSFVFFATTLWGVEAITFSDDFSINALKPAPSWEVISGSFPTSNGKMLARSDRGDAFAVIRELPELEGFEYAVRFTPAERTTVTGWATAGIAVYQDNRNHWRLQFVEGPDQKRSFEMGETLDGLWQAQSIGSNKLRCSESFTGTWEYGTAYQMKVSLTTNGIEGEVVPASGGKPLARYRYFWDSAKAVTLGRPGITATGLTVQGESVRVTASWPVASAPGILLENGKAGRCALLSVDKAGESSARVALLSKTARDAGFGVNVLSSEDLLRAKVLSRANFDVLMLPDPRFPAGAREILYRYLRNGGHAVMLGGRAFGSPLFSVDGKWMSRQQIEGVMNDLKPSAPLFDFATSTVTWDRSSDQKDKNSTAKIESGNLRLDIKGYTLWDTFAAKLPRKIERGAPLLILSLKGDATTPQIAFELYETDGSRWIAVLEIAPEMKRVVLMPQRFKPWNAKAKEKSGLEVERVEKISIGLAGTHTLRVAHGDHTIWIGAIGTAENKFEGIDLSTEITLPVFGEDDDSTLGGAVAVASAPSSPFQGFEKVTGSVEGLSAIGFAIPNESVSVPLLEAMDPYGRKVGYAAGLLLHVGGGYRKSAWLYSGITSDAFYRSPAFSAFLMQALLAMKKGDLIKKVIEDDQARLKNLALSSPPPKGFIHVGKDGHFANGDGSRFFMTGCNYIGSFATETQFCQDENFDPRELEANFRMAKSAGINVIRLFHVHGLAADFMKGDRRKLDTILELARRYGIYLLLETSAGLSATGVDMAETCAILTRTAELLKDEPMIFGYDLRNEPVLSSVAGMNYPEGRKPSVQTTRLIEMYPEEATEIQKLIQARPGWLKLSATLIGRDAENTIASIYLWNQYTREFNLASTTFGDLPPSGLPTPAKWQPLVKAVDETYGLWIQMQKDAVRQADTNHLMSVGYNLVFAALPCNEKLDFVSHHVYGKPNSFAGVMENLTTLDRLKKLFPTQPISLGEFGYSTGIVMPGGGNLDPDTAGVGEMMHYLYAFANGYEGCKKWMLVDWPLAVMQRYGSWSQHGLEGKRYEARFGLFAYDGSPEGRPKPIAYALRFLREYADNNAPSGSLSISEGPLSIGAVYVYSNKNALFIGNKAYEGTPLSFHSKQAANVMLTWGPAGIRVMSSADALVTLTPSAIGVFGQSVKGRHGELRLNGNRMVIEMLAGETLVVK